jgi:hypothetical protein
MSREGRDMPGKGKDMPGYAINVQDRSILQIARVGELDFVKSANCRNSTMNYVSDKGINGAIEDIKGETESKPWMNVMSPFFTSAFFLKRESTSIHAYDI